MDPRDAPWFPRLLENLHLVREQMAEAAQASGRSPEEVRLVAVTKYAPIEVVRGVVAAGCCDLGESRPQMLWDKASALSDLSIRWHQIGALQRNKVARTVPLLDTLHACDRLSLLNDVTAAANAGTRPLKLLLEVKLSDEATKHGFSPEEIENLIGQLTPSPHTPIVGLMTMAPRDADAAAARACFARLRELRDRCQQLAPAEVVLRELSMGMSGDFVEAIHEGATLVRVGSALFEGVSE